MQARGYRWRWFKLSVLVVDVPTSNVLAHTHIVHSTSHGTNAAVSPGMQVSSVPVIDDVLCRSRRNSRLGAQQDGPTPT